MPNNNHRYFIDLWHEAYFSKNVEVVADRLSEACQIAMECADDGCDWEDTLLSSTHWIESIDKGVHSVPEECSAAALRCGGAVMIANRLRSALASLVQTCEDKPGVVAAISGDLEETKAVLQTFPARITASSASGVPPGAVGVE